jgi:hypothetical protein
MTIQEPRIIPFPKDKELDQKPACTLDSKIIKYPEMLIYYTPNNMHKIQRTKTTYYTATSISRLKWTSLRVCHDCSKLELRAENFSFGITFYLKSAMFGNYPTSISLPCEE